MTPEQEMAALREQLAAAKAEASEAVRLAAEGLARYRLRAEQAEQQTTSAAQQRDALRDALESDQWVVVSAVVGAMKPGDVITAEGIQPLIEAMQERIELSLAQAATTTTEFR